MNDKERLEEIKEHLGNVEIKPHKQQVDVLQDMFFDGHIDYLIELAENYEKLSEKMNDVQKYLQENQVVNDDVNYWGKNVIGVLLDVSKKQDKLFEAQREELNRVSGQAMRFQDEKSELEEMLSFSESERVGLIEKNRRHREAIKKAHKLNHDEDFNYDVDKILLRALEEK